MSKAGRQYKSSSTHTVSSKKSRARATAAINDYIVTLRGAIFTPTGKDKDVTEGIAPMFMKYDRNGVNVEISFASKLSKQELAWAFATCKGNMEDKYDRSGYGWDDEDKKKEFTEEGTRFLLIREKNPDSSELGRLVGFVHFRFSVLGDVVDQMVGTPSLFVWDLHLDEEIRRKGLGKHLMTILELVARREKMQHLSIPVQMFDEDTTAWIEHGMKGYNSDIILREVLAFDPDMEGFNVFCKAIGAASKVVAVAPESASPITVTGEPGTITPTKAKVTTAKASPQSVFEFHDSSATAIDGAVSSGESDGNDSESDREDEGQEVDISKLDLHDTIHGLKVLFKEKHGEEPSDEVMEQWLQNLKLSGSEEASSAPDA